MRRAALTAAGAVATWAVPFVLGIPLVDPAAGRPVIGILAFKSLMVAAFLGVGAGVFRALGRRGALTAATPFVIFAVNAGLDLGVLVGLLGADPAAWALTTLPAYAIALGGLRLAFRKDSR